MVLEHIGMPQPGDCRVVFSASAEELEAAIQAEQAAENPPQTEEDLLTAAVNRAILTGFSTLYQELVEKEHLVPVTDPDFELLAVNRADGFRAGAEFYCLPPLELERYTGFTQPIQPRPIRELTIELEINRRHGDEDRAADAEGIIGDVEILRVAVACCLEVRISGLLRSVGTGKALPLAVNGNGYRMTACGRLVDLGLRDGIIKIRHEFAHFRKCRSAFLFQKQRFFLAHSRRFRLGGFRRGWVMLRLVKTQSANLHIIGEVVFVGWIYRHGFLGVSRFLFRLRIPLHEPREALPALRTGDGIEKRRVAEGNIKDADALDDIGLAVFQIHRIAYGIRERFSLRDRSRFGSFLNCFLRRVPSVLLLSLIHI